MCNVRLKKANRSCHLHQSKYKKQITKDEIKRRLKYYTKLLSQEETSFHSISGFTPGRTDRNVSNKILGCGKRRWNTVVAGQRFIRILTQHSLHLSIRFLCMQFLRNPLIELSRHVLYLLVQIPCVFLPAGFSVFSPRQLVETVNVSRKAFGHSKYDPIVNNV